MTEINKAGAFNYTQAENVKSRPSRAKEETVKQPSDEVTLSKPKKSVAKKIIEFPGKVLGAVGGAAVGAASAPLHIIPGAVKGIQEGLASHKGEGSQGLFHFAMWAQNLAIGAGAGLVMGGPIGAAIGAGAAILFTGATSYMGHKAEAYDMMVEHVEDRVDKAISDNEGSKMKVLVQNATEGSIIGSGAAAKVGWKVGYEAGKGVVEGVFGAIEGLAEGVYEAGKSIAKDVKK